MQGCEKKDNCVFFAGTLKGMPSISNRLKKQYCMDDKDSCARYMVHKKLMNGFAPKDDSAMSFIDMEMKTMFPNETPKAEKIIALMVQTF